MNSPCSISLFGRIKSHLTSRRLAARHLVLTAGTVFITLLLTVAGTTIYVQRQQAIEEWRGNLATLSRLLAEHARQSVAAADLVQKSIADRVTELGVADDRGLRQFLGNRTTFDMLKDKVSGVPQIDVASIVAANGDVLNFTRSYPPPPINLADRDYIQAHFTDAELKLHLSLPVKSRGTGRWTFYLTRKIKTAKGNTIGLTLAGIESPEAAESDPKQPAKRASCKVNYIKLLVVVCTMHMGRVGTLVRINVMVQAAKQHMWPLLHGLPKH